MLLEKLEQNRHSLMQIGQKAIRRGRELGLTPSCADLDNSNHRDDEDTADHGNDEPPVRIMKR